MVEQNLENKKLLVLIPVLNEAATIQSVINRIPDHPCGIGEVSITVIDDGSTDNTSELAKEAGADVVSHTRNQGVGMALRTGLHEALRRGADYVVNIDGDGQFAPEDITALLTVLLEENADMVTASRFKDASMIPQMPWIKKVGNWGMAQIVSTLTGQKFHDVSCGFRAYQCDALKRILLIGRFTYAQEMFLAMAYHGRKIVEVPIPVRGVREFGKSRVASNLFRYAVQTLSIILAFVRDYRPAMFFNFFALLLFFIGFVSGTFIGIYFITYGAFSPYTWVGFMAAYCFGLGIAIFIFGQIALMLSRQRMLQEEILYLMRSKGEKDGGYD